MRLPRAATTPRAISYLQRRLPRFRSTGLLQSCSAILRSGSMGPGFNLTFSERILALSDPAEGPLVVHETVLLTRTIATAILKFTIYDLPRSSRYSLQLRSTVSERAGPSSSYRRCEA